MSFIEAAESGLSGLNTCRAMIQQGVDVNQLGGDEEWPVQALHVCHHILVKDLIDAGANIEGDPRTPESPLEWALVMVEASKKNGRNEKVNELIRWGASLHKALAGRNQPNPEVRLGARRCGLLWRQYDE